MTDLHTIRSFLDLPPEALPAAYFVSEDDSWAHDAWETLRRALETGDTVAQCCGTAIRLHADRPEWADGVIVHSDETIRHGSFGPIVWRADGTTRMATQDDLDTLPVGDDLTEAEEASIED